MEKVQFWDLKWQPSGAKLPPEWHSDSSAGSQLPQCILNLNWSQPMANSVEFESALGSLVSTPTSDPPASIGALVGRVGSNICNAGEISPSSRHCIGDSSCYSTHPSSPPRLDLSAMGHRERGGGGGWFPLPANRMPGAAAHLGPFLAGLHFEERSSGDLAAQFGLLETGNFSRVSSSHSRIGFPTGTANELYVEMKSKLRKSSTPAESELGNGQEESSLSDRMTAEASSMRGISISDSNASKRKAPAKRRGKEAPFSSSATNLPANMAEEENPEAKRSKPADRNVSRKNEAMKMKADKDSDSGQEQARDEVDDDAKPPEPSKDYIHVRARRGQATDAHSLAERVRREKISKRMKFLQDLVPGCNKITGKAVMLDEIINYVQSLQQQVEFLSMKLSTLNPQLDLNMETLLSKEMYQASGLIPVYPVETMSTVLSYVHQPQSSAFSFNPLESFLRQSQSFLLAHAEGYADATSQIGNFWENDLQSAAQIGFGQNLEMTATAFPHQIVHGQVHTNQMKIEPYLFDIR